MADYYGEPATEISFGDIFDAEFFHDVFLKADAVQMGTFDLVKKYGGGLGYGASFERNREFVLGHGAPCRAVLITDSCAVDAVLGQGGDGRERVRPTGRLLFAPVVEWPADKAKPRTFGRAPLPAWEDRLPAGMAELRRCFMVNAKDVVSHSDQRIACLLDDAAAELEVHWNAYAARRGPLANARNAEKAAELAASGADDPDEMLARTIAEALFASWRVEGGSLEAISDAHSEGRDGEPELGQLEEALRELGEKSIQAADSLAARNTPPNGGA